MVSTWLLMVALSLGQEGEEPEVAAAEEQAAPAEAEGSAESDGGSTEVIVFSERLVEAARLEVVGRAAQIGYTKALRKGDRTILRHELPWKGDVVLFDDGRVEVKRQPLQFAPPFKRQTPLTWLSCIIVPLCIRPNGQLVSQRRFIGYERGAWAAIASDVSTWNDAMAEYGLGLKVAGLPDRLEALWEQGTPLDGTDETPLATPEARRGALLSFWDSRTDTSWGDEVRGAVEAFMRAVVQTSEHPYLSEELAAFAATQRSSRQLVLSRGPADTLED